MKIAGVTLACADCVHPRLAATALAKSLQQCDFERTVLFTDATRETLGTASCIEVVPIARLASPLEYSRFMLKDLVRHIETDFVQIVQWDGYVVRGAAWTDAFRGFDYIGARWWFRPAGQDVGNGGFSLRSRRLLEALRDDHIVPADPEDNVICLQHREWLEKEHGIRFADTATAQRYSFEGESPNGKEFGFHRVFNLPHFNRADDLARTMNALDDAEFCSPATVTMIQKLVHLGRKREAIAYSRRLCSDPARHATISREFRELLRRLMLTLANPRDPCPCGSGLAYRRCCGRAEKWPST